MSIYNFEESIILDYRKDIGKALEGKCGDWNDYIFSKNFLNLDRNLKTTGLIWGKDFEKLKIDSPFKIDNNVLFKVIIEIVCKVRICDIDQNWLFKAPVTWLKNEVGYFLVESVEDIKITGLFALPYCEDIFKNFKESKEVLDIFGESINHSLYTKLRNGPENNHLGDEKVILELLKLSSTV